MIRRRWAFDRQAYSPRWWPTVIVSATAAFAGPYVLGLTAWWQTILWATACGFIPPKVQWWWWRRRHPALTVEQAEQVFRDSARWN